MPLEEAGRRYLGVEHGQQLRAMHARLVAELRALSRRSGDRRWRLIGIDVGGRTNAPSIAADAPPDVLAWAEAHGLDGWSEAELLEMYAEAFPPSAQRGARRVQRNARLRARQLEVLAALEGQAAEPARPSDPVEGWFDPALAARLRAAGFMTLGALARAIAMGGRWYRALPAIGATKARRIAQYLENLLATAHGGMWPEERQGVPALPRLGSLPDELDGSVGSNRASRSPTIAASNDFQALAAWIGASARSSLTADAYRREGERWLLWCVLERGKPLSSAGPDDCVRYMAFLNAIPPHWQSRRPAARLELGWTPFRGPLSLASRRFAVKVLHLMCQWLTVHGRYLDSNPWAAVHRGLVDGQELPAVPHGRALSRAAYEALLQGLPNPTCPGETRNGFILAFARHTGLRASELLAATIDQLSQNEDGWRLRVVVKGRKPREVSVPSPAMAALEQQLAARRLQLDACPPGTRLLVAQDGESAVSYSAVHQSFARFVKRTLARSALPVAERARAAGATQHWLRHTFATQAAAAADPTMC